MQRRETGRAIHRDPALWPYGQQARSCAHRRCIAVVGTALLLLSSNVVVAGTSAATLTSTPTHNTYDVRGYSTGTPVSVFVTATETATATAAVTATSTPTTATTATTTTSTTAATVVTTATRTLVAQPLIVPDATPAHITATPPMAITHPVTTAPASTTGAGTAVIQPISLTNTSSPAGTNATATTATATALRTPNAITASAAAMRTTTAIASGTAANATNGAKASLTPAATVTVTTTARPPRNSGLALLGPPMTVGATAEDIANGGSVVIARVALRHLGEFARPDGVPWFGWCEMFVGNVADEAGMFHTRFPSALTDSYAATLFRERAPAGSLVFFDQRSDLYGHVGIALGDGTMISALGPGITRTAYEQWGSYIGWRPYPGLGTGHASTKAATDVTHAAIPEALSPAPTRGDEESGYTVDEIAPCQTP